MFVNIAGCWVTTSNGRCTYREVVHPQVVSGCNPGIAMVISHTPCQGNDLHVSKFGFSEGMAGGGWGWMGMVVPIEPVIPMSQVVHQCAYRASTCSASANPWVLPIHGHGSNLQIYG